MSRRLRVEQELIKQLQEADEEDDKIKRQQEKIFAPVTWARLHSGFRVLDLREKYFAEVIDLIKNNYINKEILCKNTEIEDDPVSLKSFLDHVMYILKDCSSIMVVDEKNEDVLVGALLLQVVNKAEFTGVFGRVTYRDGEARKKCMEITTALSRKVDIYTLYNCDCFLRYCIVCIKDEYRHKNLGYQLMRIGIDVARSFNIPVVSGIFTSFNLQKYAKRLDFKVLQEVSYTNWRDKNNELIFSDPGAGNYTCALMVAEVPEKARTDPLVIKKLTPAEMRVIEPPRTRAEKRSLLTRQKPNF